MSSQFCVLHKIKQIIIKQIYSIFRIDYNAMNNLNIYCTRNIVNNIFIIIKLIRIA